MASTVDSASLKYETLPNNEVSSNVVSTVRRDFPVKSMGFDPAVQLLERMDEVRGTEDEPVGLVNGYQPAGTITHNAYADDLIFFFGLAGLVGTYTAGDGIIVDPDAGVIPTGAARWVFVKRGGNVPKTAEWTAVFADEAQWLRLKGGAIAQMGMNMDGELSINLAALYMSRLTSDPNLTPTLAAQSIPFFRRIDLTVPTWLASHGVTSDFTWQFTNPTDAIKTPAVQSLWPDVLLNANERTSLTGTMVARTMTSADIDILISAGSFNAKAKWLSSKKIGATNYSYTMWLEMPNCQIVGGSIDPLTNQRQFGTSLNWRARLDDTLGYSTKFTVVGSVTTVSSVGN